MPSTTSSSVSSDLASSTVITPSLPTLCIASAIIRPISRSLLAETVPTCAISSLVETFLVRFPMSATTASTARSMPRFRSIGFMPAATAFAPNRLGQNRRGRRAVASGVAGLRRDFAHHLSAHVLELVGKLDFLGDRDAVLADARRAKGFVEDDVSALGAQRHLDRIGENIDAAEHALARIGMKPYFFCRHDLLP